MDKLSIITVSYNAQNYIEETINCVAELEWKNKELIIIDGKSTDGTLDIIKRNADKIDYWCSEEDDGIYDAMNKGIRNATGEWVTFLNCGDVFYRDSCSWIGTVSESVDVVYGNYAIINEFSELGMRRAKPLRNMLYQMISCHQAFFVRRSLFKEIGEFDISYKIAADYAWLLDCYLLGKKFYYVDKLIVNYRAGGLSEAEYEITYREYMRVCCEKLKNNNSINFETYADVLNDRRKRSCYYFMQNEFEKGKGDRILKIIVSDKKYVEYRKLAIWCIGKYGKQLIRYLNSQGIEVDYCVDKSIKKYSVEAYNIFLPDCLTNYSGLVIIATSDVKSQSEIKELLSNGLCKDYSVITLDDLGEMAYEESINAEMKCLERSTGS